MERGPAFDRPRVAIAGALATVLVFMLVWHALGINAEYRPDPVIVTALLTAIGGLVGVEVLDWRRRRAESTQPGVHLLNDCWCEVDHKAELSAPKKSG